MRKPIIAIVGMLAIAALSTAAQQKMAVPIGTLEGIVVDAHDKPVANASVTIQTSDGLQPHATRTDAEGHFQAEIGSAGDTSGHFGRPKGVAVDSYGHVYVADAVFGPKQRAIIILRCITHLRRLGCRAGGIDREALARCALIHQK